VKLNKGSSDPHSIYYLQCVDSDLCFVMKEYQIDSRKSKHPIELQEKIYLDFDTTEILSLLLSYWLLKSNIFSNIFHSVQHSCLYKVEEMYIKI
jgi:hypothetical protein